MNSVRTRSVFAYARLRAKASLEPDEAEQHVIQIDAHTKHENVPMLRRTR